MDSIVRLDPLGAITRQFRQYPARGGAGLLIDQGITVVCMMGLNKAFRLLFSRIETEDRRRGRLYGILQGAVTSLGNRVVGLLVSFLSVPLTINYLGPERYGAWVTLGSLLAWLQLSEFGLGNGLMNAIGTAASQDRPDLVRIHLSNGLLLLSAIAAVTAVAAALAWPFINWSALFGVSGEGARVEIGPAVAAALAIFLLQFPLSVGGRVYLAYQEGLISNCWAAAGNVLSLLALLVVTQTQGGLVWLVIAVSGTPMLVNLVNNAWLFLIHKPFLLPRLRHLEFANMRVLSQVGGKFFLIQIMALVTFQTDYLVIGYYLGAARVPEYSLTYTLFTYTNLPQSIIFPYLWAAYNEAIARKDMLWVSSTFHLNLVAGLSLTVVAVTGLAFIAKPFIAWWAGADVVPSSTLIVWMAGWTVVNAFTSPIACLLAAAAHLRAQIIYSAAAALSNIILSLFLVQRWGVEGVIAATVISYLVFICIPAYVDVRLLIRRML